MIERTRPPRRRYHWTWVFVWGPVAAFAILLWMVNP